MKSSLIKLIMVCGFIILLVSQRVSAMEPWYKVSADIDSETLNDITVINDSILIAVGNLGSIKRSKDKGMTWNTVHGKYDSQDLLSVDNIDSLVFASGRNGSLLFSDDYGESWSKLDINEENDLTSISFAGSNGIIVGDNGTILITTNYGKDWEKHDFETQEKINDVQYIDQNIAIAVGNNGLMIKSTNNGDDWLTIDLGVNSDLRCLSVNDNGDIIVAGNNSALIKSQDQFLSWAFINSENSPKSFVSILYVNEEIIIAGIMKDNFLPLQTFSTDGGQNWVYSWPTSLPNNAFLITNDRKTAFLVGNDASIIKIDIENDLAEYNFKWFSNIVFQKPKEYYFRAINGYNSEVLIASGDVEVLISLDSGLTWNKRHDAREFKHSIISAYALDARTYLALEDSIAWVSEDGKNKLKHFSTISKTTDSGDTWVRSKIDEENTPLKKISFKTPDYIAAFGTKRFFFVSTNQADNWIRIDAPDSLLILDLSVIDYGIIYLLGRDEDGKVYFCSTNDNGKNWDVRENDDFNQIFITFMYFISDDIGWVAIQNRLNNKNQRIYVTRDAGMTWDKQYDKILDFTQAINDLKFADENNGLCLLHNGLLLKTSDGGDNWIETYYKSDEFLDLPGKLYYPNKTIAFVTDQQYVFRHIDDNITSMPENNNSIEDNLTLKSYPNPASGFTNISYWLNIPGNVNISIHDIFGRKVKTISDGYKTVGGHSEYLGLTDLSTGVYYIVLTAGSERKTVKFSVSN